MTSLTDRLLASEEASIRFKIRVRLLSEDEDSHSIRALRKEIAKSPRIEALLSDRDEEGRIRPARHPYKKWTGAHWVLATLADIGYPPGDKTIEPIRNQVFDYWLAPYHLKEEPYDQAPPRHREKGVPVVRGRARRCASQQGNALFSAVRLGHMDERCDILAGLLLKWQWEDGGWNCDRKAEACNSSFWESLIPLRALVTYAEAAGDSAASDAAARAAEIFLKRGLFRRRSDGEVMNRQFVRLHYPCYWHYDVLFGLKVMAEAGFIRDPRCNEALDLLESKELPEDGWPAEERFYNSDPSKSNAERVSWGGVNKKRMNEWVTADALYVLQAAGRLNI